MAQVMPAKFRDHGAFKYLCPRRLESGSASKTRNVREETDVIGITDTISLRYARG
jgi:hypothetical protein